MGRTTFVGRPAGTRIYDGVRMVSWVGRDHDLTVGRWIDHRALRGAPETLVAALEFHGAGR